jgi:subtilase family serine protease
MIENNRERILLRLLLTPVPLLALVTTALLLAAGTAHADGNFTLIQFNTTNITAINATRLLPDLITGLSADRTELYVGESFTVTERTLNIGRGRAKASSTASHMVFRGNGYGNGGSAYVPKPVLRPGQYADYNGTFYCGDVGNYTFSAQADYFNNVTESNETNNNAWAAVNVTCTAPQGSDLVTRFDKATIGNYTYYPSNGRIFIPFNTNVTFYETTSNIGGAFASPSTTVIGTVSGRHYLAKPSIAPNSSIQSTFTYKCRWDETINVTADYFGEVSESNESNNFVELYVGCVW